MVGILTDYVSTAVSMLKKSHTIQNMYFLQNGWKAVSEKGTVYEDLDLREDWVDYCEKAQVSVGVFEFQSRFVRK
jgi:hypothetical protein